MFSVFGPLAAVHQILPGMRFPRLWGWVAGTSIALAGEGAFARMLHTVLRPENIHVAQLIIPGAITPGHSTHGPDVLAALWRMHTDRDTFRVFAEPMNLED